MALSRIRQQPRRYTIPALAFALLAFAALVFGRWTEPARATSGGNPYVVPLVVDTNPDAEHRRDDDRRRRGRRSTSATASSAHAQTFNGTIPGPTFRLKVGDTVIVHFENDLAHATGIHWHGIELPNAIDGTPLTQNQVAPGRHVPLQVHGHAARDLLVPPAPPLVDEPGLQGPLRDRSSSTDPNETALVADGTLPPRRADRTLVLSDITVCKAPGTNDAATYDADAARGGGGAAAAAGWRRRRRPLRDRSPIDEDGDPRGAVRGRRHPEHPDRGAPARDERGPDRAHQRHERRRPRRLARRARARSLPGAQTLDVQAGQGLRLQIVNAATTRFFRLRLTDERRRHQIPLVRVGGQGGLLDDAVVEGGVRRPRFDTKYTPARSCSTRAIAPTSSRRSRPSATGVLTLWTQDFERTGGGRASRTSRPSRSCTSTSPATAPSTYTIAAGNAAALALDRAIRSRRSARRPAALLNPADVRAGEARACRQDIQLDQRAALARDQRRPRRARLPRRLHRRRRTSARRATRSVGDILELTVTNTTGAHHPFHLHGFSIQPISLTTRPARARRTPGPYTEFRDNVDIPAGYTLTLPGPPRRPRRWRTASRPAARSAAGSSTATSSSTPPTG